MDYLGGQEDLTVDLQLDINGVRLRPGDAPDRETLRQAGLGKLPPWRRWMRRLPGGSRYWTADDPRVTCFDGSLEIYPCRDSYLDPDRRWGTRCLVRMDGETIQEVAIEVVEGVYAAGNLFDRFLENARKVLGEPAASRRRATWQAREHRVAASLDREGVNAVFRWEYLNGDR
jgi:hypothetical protein